MPNKDENPETKTCVCQSNFSDVLSAFSAEMKSKGVGWAEEGFKKIIDDPDGARVCFIVTGVIGAIQESIDAALEKSR